MSFENTRLYLTQRDYSLCSMTIPNTPRLVQYKVRNYQSIFNTPRLVQYKL